MNLIQYIDQLVAGGPGSGRKPEFSSDAVKEHFISMQKNATDALSKQRPGQGLPYHREERQINGHKVVATLQQAPVNRGRNFGTRAYTQFIVNGKARGIQKGIDEVSVPKKDIKAGGPGSGRHKGYSFEHKTFVGQDQRTHHNVSIMHKGKLVGQVEGKEIGNNTLKTYYAKVDEGHRGKGLAKAAYEKLFSKAKDAGISTVQSSNFQTAGGKGVWKNMRTQDKSITKKPKYFEKKLSAMSAGGPGSGRHKEFGITKKQKPKLRSDEREALLTKQRKQVIEQYRKNQSEGKSARGKPIISDKQKLAQKSVVTASKDHQDKAEEVERLIAKKLPGYQQSSNNKPFDVFGKDGKGKSHAIEVKSLLLQHNDKITMKQDAINRKTQWAKQNKSQMHTVAVDLRGNKPVVYHRAGVGSFRLGNMTKVEGGLNGLHKLFA